MRFMKRFLLITLFLALAGTFAANPAQARGRVIIGGGVIAGRPYYPYPPYYGYPYYEYAPAPYPVYAQPYPLPPPRPADHYYTGPEGRYCREYTHTVVVGGVRQSAYGHACREPDGSWQIID